MRSCNNHCANSPSPAGWERVAFALVLLLACVAPTFAAPIHPADPQQVLLTLGDASARAQLRELHRSATVQININEQQALQLARQYIALGRAQADDRYYGNAAAVLAPLLTRATVGSDALLLKANVLQHRHQFDAAAQLLDGVLKKEPFNAEAHLMRASIYFATGRSMEAQQDCRALARAADAWFALVCNAELQSLTGRLDTSYTLLNTLHDGMAAHAAPAMVAWIRALLGDMAERRGDDKAAEQWWRLALQMDRDDLATRLALADLLIQQQRSRQAVQLLDTSPPSEGVLLRRALALRQFKDTNADSALSAWREQLARNRQLGISAHLREQAIGELKLLGDKQQALLSARDNWHTQREPADARIYLEAAIAAKSVADIDAITEWQRRSGLQDVVLENALARTKRSDQRPTYAQSNHTETTTQPASKQL